MMKAWQFVTEHNPLELHEVPEPEPGQDEVVLDVKGAGICHSDVGFLDGTLSGLLPYRPITLGHEIAGIVSAVGPGVDRFSVGDRVAIPCDIPTPGTSMDGGFAEKVLTPARFVIPIPDGVPFDQAAAATDAGMTSYHAAITVGGVKAGDKVGIIGVGGLGSVAVQVCVGVGAEVYAAEVNEQTHGYVRELGASGVATDMHDFADKGLDVIIDYAGFGTTTAAAIDVVRPDGVVVQVGLGRPEGTINLQRLTLERLTLIGSQAGTQEDCAAVLQLIKDGKVTSRIEQITLDQIGDGVQRLERGDVTGRLVAVS
jgi:D-arabinose 1-dehydrogenase-like Zn-dependent alcohol dehydrogenase